MHRFMFSYISELRLVRLKISEGGVYTFQASNGDAAANQTFTVFVISKLCLTFSERFRVPVRHISTLSFCH